MKIKNQRETHIIDLSGMIEKSSIDNEHGIAQSSVAAEYIDCRKVRLLLRVSEI